MTADVVMLPTMWVRRIESGVLCIISVRDFSEAIHEDLKTDGYAPRPVEDAPTEQSAADVAPIEDTEVPAPVVPDMQALNATKAINMIRATDWSAAGLEVASDQESEGKKRKTVLRAIKAQRAELEE